MKFFLLSLITAVLIIGCDPARRINMQNKSGGDAEITWIIKEDSMHSSPFFIASSKEQTFVLTADRPGNSIRMSAGVGTWTPKYLRDVVNDLDTVIIRWNGKEIKLSSEDEIYTYLLARRKGIGKDKIQINLND